MRLATIVLCITALMMIGGIALAASEENWGDHGAKPYTGEQWRWCVDPGDRSENVSTNGHQGKNLNATGERNVNYAYAWGDDANSGWWYYNWNDYKWYDSNNESEWPDEFRLEIDADIEMFCKSTMEFNRIYFHRWDRDTHMATDWGFTIASNNGQWFFICVPDGCDWGDIPADGYQPATGGTIYGGYLDQVSRAVVGWDWYSGGAGAYNSGSYGVNKRRFDKEDCDLPDGFEFVNDRGEAVIPFDIAMYDKSQDPDTWVMGEYSGDGNNGNTKGLTFTRPDGYPAGCYKPGYSSSIFRCHIYPHAYQPDGRYILDPVVEVAATL
jgi:hypothetical protein